MKGQLTEAANGVRVIRGTQLKWGALRLALLVVKELVALYAGRISLRQPPAYQNCGAVQGLQMQLRRKRNCGWHSSSSSSSEGLRHVAQTVRWKTV